MKLTYRRFGLLTILISSIFLSERAPGQIHFGPGSPFRYLKGSQATGLSVNWINPSFDDSGWAQGNTPIRYGDGSGGTVLDDMQNNYSTVYMRSTFTVQNVASLAEVTLTYDFDDGFIIWINGKEVHSINAPLDPGPGSFSTDLHESGTFESYVLEPEEMDLVEGENTLAVMGFNTSLESSDFMFNLGIDAGFTLPFLEDTIGLDFSVPAGFYEDTFSVEITPADPSWKVVYTLDGSNPQESGSAIVADGPVTVLIDPYSLDGRAATPCVTLRASSMTDGILPSLPETRTYIFLEQVLQQDYPGGDWPTGNVNGQYIDLPMDPRIVYDPDYSGQMIASMKDVPSISLVTDIDNLFGSEIGIYVNAEGHGEEWERECSVELINPDGSEGFNVNAGLRIRGGWSRHNTFPKHSFRLFFRSRYGDPKLYFPLFGDEGVDRYDKIDLRTSQNYAWAQGDPRNTMLRDVFSRDTQGDMGQPYTRSRYYHLYLNGMYWGLFQTQERSEARFAADYLGGDTDDYDVVKVNTEDWVYRIEATDGTLDTWSVLWDMCNEGFEDNAAYFRLEGKDSSGKPIAGMQVLVDIDNLIDYMLSIFYTGNFDAPTSSFGGNRGPNNFYAIFNREDLSKGFTFYNHDAEHSLFPYVASPGTGLTEDRVNLNMRVDNFDSFHPQWLHSKLTANEEYRVRFSDRAHMFLEGNGALTEAKNRERLEKRFDEMKMAIIGESARWGDGMGGSGPFTKNDNWLPEVNKIRNDYFPYRTDIVIGQLETAGLYSETDAPVFFLDDEIEYDPEVEVDGPVTLKMENPNGFGSIYYTLNGQDPRMIGGSPLPGKLDGGDEKSIQINGSAVVKARVNYLDEWSALKEIRIVAPQEDYSGLVITELHYHPIPLVMKGDTIPGRDMEFVEFKNISSTAINLSGLVLDSAIYYEFPQDELLAPGAFYVVASKPSKFFLRYGMACSGNYSKNFANGGEEILLQDNEGVAVIHFMYSDELPWPIEADGKGNSLVSAETNPTGNPVYYYYWRASTYAGGSPFKDDPILTSLPQPENEQVSLVMYPNPTSGKVFFKWTGDPVSGPADVGIYNLSGQEIFRAEVYGNDGVDLEQLGIASGVYIVKVSVGGRYFVDKIIYR